MPPPLFQGGNPDGLLLMQVSSYRYGRLDLQHAAVAADVYLCWRRLSGQRNANEVRGSSQSCSLCAAKQFGVIFLMPGATPRCSSATILWRLATSRIQSWWSSWGECPACNAGCGSCTRASSNVIRNLMGLAGPLGCRDLGWYQRGTAPAAAAAPAAPAAAAEAPWGSILGGRGRGRGEWQ